MEYRSAHIPSKELLAYHMLCAMYIYILPPQYDKFIFTSENLEWETLQTLTTL